MKVYCIFDDFPEEAKSRLTNAGIDLKVHPFGVPRPGRNEMIQIMNDYDGIIIGTSQKIDQEMLDGITDSRIIATASVGLDHIHIPQEKRMLIKVINTPKANARSVAEYTMGCALSCCKRIAEGNELYFKGMDNKALSQKPEDLFGKVMGVIGAGNISEEIMKYAKFFGMEVLFWTPHREKHKILEINGMKYSDLSELCEFSDVISVNLPNKKETNNLLSESLVFRMKDNAIVISVSRLPVIDWNALKTKALHNRNFYVCLDIDSDSDIVSELRDIPNISVTPHIAGGTVETRRRMFNEIADSLVNYVKERGIYEISK